MSRTDLLVSPSRQAAEQAGGQAGRAGGQAAGQAAGQAGGHPAGQAKGCRFASNCSCVFAPAEPAEPAERTVQAAPAGTSRDAVSEIQAEVAVLLQRGWKVASADEHRVVLTRRRAMPFCVNVGLLLVTGFLWSIYMVARARHPKIETTVLNY